MSILRSGSEITPEGSRPSSRNQSFLFFHGFLFEHSPLGQEELSLMLFAENFPRLGRRADDDDSLKPPATRIQTDNPLVVRIPFYLVTS